ncbi:MAG TPA: GAF domain-containing protein [Chryseosolibacter sp.]|nr:GAF domain-containing protein [Chryseosolibacter sp.]
MKLTKAIRYTVIFGLAGMAISFFVIYVQQHILKTYETHMPLSVLADQVKEKAAASNLNLQALLAGSTSLNFDEHVAAPLGGAVQTLQAAYEGASVASATYLQVDDEDTRALLKEASIQVEKLSAISREIWDGRGSGGAIDERYTASYKLTLAAADRLSAQLRANAERETSELNGLSWISAGLALLGFASLCTFLYQVQRSSDKRIGEHAKKLEEEKKRVSTLSQFIEAVSAGNYDIELSAASEEDNLTATLVNMRNKLKQNAEDDRKRNWTTTGQAQIGEILRATISTSSELYDNIIKFLVKYTNSNQGGMFILNEENESDRFLELVACYAFERKKYLEKKVLIGDGLVGQCFLEGETVRLVDVPHEYIRITSGLGGSNPSALLIVPMKVNDRVYGVIELASFKKYEDFEIELVEKLAESIASTISNVRVNETTRILLEKTQQQAEEMKSQEEEIRQNMEELEATQEEMRRKQAILEKELDQSQRQAEALRLQEKKLTESQDTLQAIVDNIPRAIFWKDRDLRFQGCNKIFSDIAGASAPHELFGKTDFDMAWSAQADAYRKDDLEVMRSRKSKLDIEEVNINSEGEESWVRTSKVPIVSQTGEVVAILGMFEDITALKRREADVAQKLREREQALQELNALKQLLQTTKR